MTAIVSWNIAGRKSKVNKQIEKLLSQDADIICLQEVIKSTLEVLKKELATNGYSVVDNNFYASGKQIGLRKYCQLIASKKPLTIIDPSHKILWKEKYLNAHIGDINLT